MVSDLRLVNQRPKSRTLPILGAAVLALILLAPATGWAQTSAPTFTKSFAPSTIGPGSVTTLRFDIVNSSASVVRDLAFTDNLPAGMTIASPASASSTCASASISAPAGGSSIDFTAAGVGANGSCEVLVNVTSSVPGVSTNVSSPLASDAGSSTPATADLTVATDRPGFSKSFSPDTVGFGERSTLTFTIDNSANAAGAANLSFTDNLPTGMTIASPANASSTCSGGTISAPAGGSTISFGAAPGVPGGATVGAGASCTVTVSVIGGSIGSLGNVSGELTSTPAPFGQIRSSGKASAVLRVVVDQVALSKTFVDDPTAPGGQVTLRFTVRNLNRDFGLTNITFTDDLDATLSGLVAASLPADPCGAGSTVSGTSVLTLAGGSLDQRSQCTFDVVLDVPSSAATGSYPNTTSGVDAQLDGRPVTGQSASDTLFVQPVPQLTKEFIDDPVGTGGSATLEFSITNTSTTSTATSIEFTDAFDLITGATTPANGFCGPSSSLTFTPATNSTPPTLSVSGASLDPGASCTFSVSIDIALVSNGGNFTNTTSTISAEVDGQTLTGNPASDDLQVVTAPFLRKAFVDDPVTAGETVSLEFTLRHDEQAIADATGISFSDDLDSVLSGLVAVGTPLADVCGVGSALTGTMTLLLDDGTLQPGESCTFTVQLQVPNDAVAGSYPNNTSNVVANVGGVDAVGNAGSDNLDIASLALTKEFTDDPVLPGETVNLRFTLVNDSGSATGISFRDDLDDALSGLTAIDVPQNDICGTGSSLTGSNGDTLLTFQGGSLGAGESCSFDVTLQVPVSTESGTYQNRTSLFFATIDGTLVLLDNATDDLVVNRDLLLLTKEFIDDPANVGDSVTLRFIASNLSAGRTVSDIAFTDDLDAVLSGLASTSGTLTDACGSGSSLDGTSLLTLSNGSLAAGTSCTIDVTLQIPAGATPAVVTNTTSEITGMVGSFGIIGAPASDDLEVSGFQFSKAFSGPVEAGLNVDLTFTIENLSATRTAVGLSFTDDLNAVLPSLLAIGLPQSDICGAGSQISGTTFLSFNGGRLLPGGSCTFSVELSVPKSADPGDYLNQTSELLLNGQIAADPATDILTVLEPTDLDADDDGVLDADDVCPDTIIPEGVPTQSLKPNRYALVDADFEFDTVTPPGGGAGDEFTTTDTGGCSCEQIIDIVGLGNGHRKHGCSVGAMRNWVDYIESQSLSSVTSVRRK